MYAVININNAYNKIVLKDFLVNIKVERKPLQPHSLQRYVLRKVVRLIICSHIFFARERCNVPIDLQEGHLENCGFR